MDHSAVAILQKVPGFTVNAAGGDAVRGEEFRVYGGRLAISPRRREVLKLKERTAHVFFFLSTSPHRITMNNTMQSQRSTSTKRGQQADKTQQKVSNKLQMYLK